jgi:hypothetical protein
MCGKLPSFDKRVILLEPSSNKGMHASRFIEWHIVIINHVQIDN